MSKKVVIEDFKVTLGDEILENLGKQKIDKEDSGTLIDEAINNSIQKAQDLKKDLIINIEFEYNQDSRRLYGLKISDRSGGIALEDIYECLTPAKKLKNRRGLNEHNMGINNIIRFFCRNGGTYSMKSFHPAGGWEIKDLISTETPIRIYDVDNPGYYGLEYEFKNIENELSELLGEFSTRNTAKYNSIWLMRCAKYRYKYDWFKENGLKFKINFKSLVIIY